MTIYSERRLVVPSQRGTKSRSRTFSFTVPDWWNELPTPIRNAESLTIFKRHLNISSVFTWILLLLHKKKHICSLYLTSPCLTSFCSEQCLKCCITSTSCDCLPVYNVLLIVFLNCKSLWIKASAKLINVNNVKICLCIQQKFLSRASHLQKWLTKQYTKKPTTFNVKLTVQC